jgi:hypothetical protein
VADNEPPEEVSVSATELPWPDPSRPIVSNQYGGYPQPGGGGPGYQQQGPGAQPVEALRVRRWPMITTVLVLILLALVIVWLLWWR